MSLRSSRMYAAAVPTMPPGLVELMEGLAKDLLKNSPDNIYKFSAQHMKKLIEIRDGNASKNDSLSMQIAKIKEKDEISQNIYGTEMMTVKTNNRTNKNNKEADEEQMNKIVKNSLNENDGSEKENEEEQKIHLDDNTIDANKTIFVDDVTDNEDILLLELRNTDTQILNTQNKMSKDYLSISDEEAADINEPIVDTTNKESRQDMSIKEAILQKNDNLREEVFQLQSIESFNSSIDLQSVDKTILENTKDNSDYINDFNNASIYQINDLPKNTIEDEVLFNPSNINNLETSNHAVFAQNYNEVNSHQNGEDSVICIEDNFNLKKSSDTEDFSRNRSTDICNEVANSMDLEKAAITIQKVFRAFLFKSKTLSTDEVTNIDLNYLVENEEKESARDQSTCNKERRSGMCRMDTVLQTVNEEKSLSLSTDDSSTLSSAATIIQAHVRGFLVRCKMPFNKTISTVSVLDSDISSAASLGSDQNQLPNKTILNIHIVPESNNFMSREESLITSVDLSLDGSPRQSSNLHPLGYDRSERRKQLKREDAIQSVTPPSNNSGKLSEELESVKETDLNNSNDEPNFDLSEKKDDMKSDNNFYELETQECETRLKNAIHTYKEMGKNTSDEADVVTPFTSDSATVDIVNGNSKLLHSGEFHDIVLPTIVSRNNSSVVREFQNVLVYFLLWNPS